MSSQINEMELQAEWMENMNQKLESEISLVSNEYAQLMSQASVIQSENEMLKKWLTDVSALSLADQALILSIKELNSEMEAKNARLELESLNSEWESKYNHLLNKSKNEMNDLDKSKALNSILKQELSRAISIHKDLNQTFTQFRFQVSEKLNEMIVQMTAYHTVYEKVNKDREDSKEKYHLICKENQLLSKQIKEKEHSLLSHQSEMDKEIIALTKDFQELECKHNQVLQDLQEKMEMSKKSQELIQSKDQALKDKDMKLKTLNDTTDCLSSKIKELESLVKKLNVEKKDCEIQLENLNENLESKDKEWDSMNDKISTLEDEKNQLKNQVTLQEKELNQLKKGKLQIEKENEKNSSTLLVLKDTLSKKESSLIDLKEIVSELENEIQEKDQVLSFGKSQMMKKESEWNAKEKEWNASHQETLKAHQTQLKQIQSKRDEFKSKNLELEKKLQIALESLHQSQEEVGIYAQDNDIQTRLINDKNKEIQNLTIQLDKSVSHLKELQESSVYKEQVKLKKENQEFQDKISLLESSEKDYINQIQDMKDAIVAYQDDVQHKTIQNDGLRKSNKKLDQDMTILIQTLTEKQMVYEEKIHHLEDQLEEAITLCEQAQSQSHRVNSLDSFKESFEDLEKSVESKDLNLKEIEKENQLMQIQVETLSIENQELKKNLETLEESNQQYKTSSESYKSKYDTIKIRFIQDSNDNNSKDTKENRIEKEKEKEYIQQMQIWKQELYQIVKKWNNQLEWVENQELTESIQSLISHLSHQFVNGTCSSIEKDKEPPLEVLRVVPSKFKSLANSLKKIHSWKSNSQSQISQATLTTQESVQHGLNGSNEEQGKERNHQFESELYRIFNGILGGRK